MTRERILTTLPDGGVAITCPAEMGIQYLMHGPTGDWHPWFERPANFWVVQFNRNIAWGVPPKAAFEFCRHMRLGGATRREAIQIISDYVTWMFGTASEIVDVSEIPQDRTYRNAWRRSSNGGDIWIDDTLAQMIDEEKCWNAYQIQI